MRVSRGAVGRGLVGRMILAGALLLVGVRTARPDSFYVSYLGAGVQTPGAAGVTSNYETFTGASGASSYTTNFNGSPYTATYSGNLHWMPADQFGGAGGTGTYLEDYTNVSIAINSSVNYFGLWLSALDQGNQIQFFSGSTLLFAFTPSDLIRMVGSCPSSAYCANPNAAFAGNNKYQQYAYLNFYDETGSFDKIVLSETTANSGLESDNHAVGVLTGDPAGTEIQFTPEPASAGLLALSAVLTAIGLMRRRDRRQG